MSGKLRRFECRKGGSKKFWEIEVTGKRILLRFGRIGSNGQNQIKRLSSPNGARNDAVYRITEKVGKGYKEVKVKIDASLKKTAKKKTAKKKTVKKKKNKKASSKLQRYYIHDNGGRPFMVEVRGRDVDVFEKTGGHHERPSNYQRRVCGFKDVTVFVPTHREKIGKTTLNADGNTLLVVEEVPTDDWTYFHCVWIGLEIYRFVTNEPVTEFHSPVGNSDVPYPYAVSENKVYLVLEKIELSKKLFPKAKNWSKTDPYTWYYDHVGRLDDTYAYEVLRERLS